MPRYIDEATKDWVQYTQSGRSCCASSCSGKRHCVPSGGLFESVANIEKIFDTAKFCVMFLRNDRLIARFANEHQNVPPFLPS